MTAELSPETVALIAAPVAAALFVLVLVLYASARSRSPVAARMERDAARRERTRRRAELRATEAREEAEPEPELALVGTPAEPGEALAVPDRDEVAAHTQTLEEARRARLVAPPMPVRDPERAELDRRQFLNKGIVGGTAFGLGIFGVASLAFLYPKASQGFGGKVSSGITPEDVASNYADKGTPLYNGEGRFYLLPLQVASDDLGKEIYPTVFDTERSAGVVAIYQKCAHLGCRVPWCDASKWFECPCHGSQYNAMGEIQRGPAPRGLSRFQFELAASGEIVVDTAKPLDAPPRGVNTTGLPEPPNHCVAG